MVPCVCSTRTPGLLERQHLRSTLFVLLGTRSDSIHRLVILNFVIDEPPRIVYRNIHLLEMTARLLADTEPADEELFDLVAMNFVEDDESSDTAAAEGLPAGTEPANEGSLEHQVSVVVSEMSSTSGPESLDAMSLQTSGPRARGQPRGHQARSPAAASQAQLSRREASVSHDAHLAEVRLRHDGARRQRVYKRESKF